MPGPTMIRVFSLTLTLLFASSASYASELVWVETLELVDIEADVATKVKAKLASELKGIGAEPVMASASTPCLDAACRSTAIRAAKAKAGVSITVVRGGPVAQISAVAFGTDGNEFARDERVVDYEGLSADAELIGGDVRIKLVAAVKGETTSTPQDTKPTDAKPADTKPADTDSSDTTSTTASDTTSTDATDVSEGGGPGLLDWVGISVTGVGAVALVGGLVTATGAYLHYNSPGAAGSLKDLDPVLLDAGMGAAVVGAVVMTAGVGVIAFSLLTDSE